MAGIIAFPSLRFAIDKHMFRDWARHMTVAKSGANTPTYSQNSPIYLETRKLVFAETSLSDASKPVEMLPSALRRFKSWLICEESMDQAPKHVTKHTHPLAQLMFDCSYQMHYHYTFQIHHSTQRYLLFLFQTLQTQRLQLHSPAKSQYTIHFPR
jgi:hypothetical protein